MAHILIIDDNSIICELLSLLVQDSGHTAMCAYTLKDGLRIAFSETCDIIILDVHLPDGDGLAALPKIRETPSSPEVIIMTGKGDPDGAELAIKSGAWDYIVKPSSNNGMLLPITRAIEYRKEKQSMNPPVLLKRDSIIGNSPQIKHCLDLVARAASNDANVLISGETGTGKELFSRAIHDNSSRAEKHFVVVDCATLPATLVESILFGYEKGTFTGADKARTGLIEQAHEGTLFLDEVGELTVSTQKAFLRVLQERQFRPLGSTREVTSHFRLIAATNRDLDAMIKNGEFREDLLFRLRTMKISLPPLREREGDITFLARYFMTQFCKQNGFESKEFSPDFFNMLTSYDWPGNVRELFNTIENAFNSARYEPTVFPIHLPIEIRVKITRKSASQTTSVQKTPEVSITPFGFFPTLLDHQETSLETTHKPLSFDRFYLPQSLCTLKEIDEKYVAYVLVTAHGNKKKAADILGITVRHLNRKLSAMRKIPQWNSFIGDM